MALLRFGNAVPEAGLIWCGYENIMLPRKEAKPVGGGNIANLRFALDAPRPHAAGSRELALQGEPHYPPPAGEFPATRIQSGFGNAVPETEKRPRGRFILSQPPPENCRNNFRRVCKPFATAKPPQNPSRGDSLRRLESAAFFSHPPPENCRNNFRRVCKPFATAKPPQNPRSSSLRLSESAASAQRITRSRSAPP